MKATARIQRVLQVMWDDLLRRSEAELRGDDVEVHEDGSGRLNVVRSKTGQEVKDTWLFVGPEATAGLRPSSPPVAYQKVEA